MFKIHTFHVFYGCLFLVILLIVTQLYWQGQGGSFVFDDRPNLQPLATLNKTGGFDDTLLFVLEGESGTLGRPVSLLSFALQAESWPFHPWDFKYVNLMIHLLNGCLVFWLILLLSRCLALSERQSLLLALLTSSVWLLHPLQVSTVLYVVQRMTQLSALFTLVGLLIYLYGRQLLANNQLKVGFFWMSVGVAVGGTLATLSKENGILLTLYILALEFTVLQRLSRPRTWHIWAGIFLYLPLFLLSFYFVTHIDNLLRTYEIRHFTLEERLLTQPRVLIDYLLKILLFKPNDFGLFHDDFVISHDLWTPPTTLMAIGFLGTMLGIAVIKRLQMPIFALAVFWFLAGHLLESSFIGLMLYFEHRNYLPMLGVIFAVIYGLLRLFDILVTPFFKKIAVLLSMLWFILLPSITWLQTDLWGKPFQQMLFWAQQNPHSIAAQAQAITFFQQRGNYSEAEKYVKLMLQDFPQKTAPYLYWLYLACLSEQVKMPHLPPIIRHFQTSQYDQIVPELLTLLVEQRISPHCQLSSEALDKMFNALIMNKNNAVEKAYLYYHYALFHAAEKRYKLAAHNAIEALALKDSLRLRLKLINWLRLAHQYDAAREAAQALRREMNPIKVHLYERDIRLLEAKIPVFEELHEKGFQIQEK
jgi:tetratricopeptide (TPR) repeat protein